MLFNYCLTIKFYSASVNWKCGVYFSLKNLLILEFLILVLLSPVYSQTNQLRFRHISIEQGLSQSTVFSIAQDKQGSMWFATVDGLNRYDGYSFKIFRNDPFDNNSISDNGIKKLYSDNEGCLWIVTFKGTLDRFDAEREKFIHYKITLNNSSDPNELKVRSLSEDSNGKLWIVTSKCCFFFYNRKNDKFIYHSIPPENEKKLEGIHPQVLYASKENILWIGSSEGLIKYDYNSDIVQKYQHKESDSHSIGGNNIFDITEDSNQRIWVASADGGVSVLNKITSEIETYHHQGEYQNNLSSERILSIVADSRSNIWMGTIDGGLDRFDLRNKSFQNIRHDKFNPWSLSNGAVLSIFEDKNGGLWIGTSSEGVNYLDFRSQNFLQLSLDENSSSNISPYPILSICEDHIGTIWVGSDGGGLCRIPSDGKSTKYYLQNPESFGSNSVTAVFEDRDGTIWVGTDPGINTGSVLIFKNNSDSFQLFDKIKLNSGGITTFYEDSEGEIWIGSSTDGVYRYNPYDGKVIHYNSNANDPNSISGNSIYSIIEFGKGIIWIGTHKSGVNSYNKIAGKFTRFLFDLANKKSINNNSVFCLFTDDSENLWLGTWGGGLNKYIAGENSFQHFTIDNGLPSNVISGILPDDSGNLWLSTNNGLCKFNLRTYHCKNYDYTDGLQGNEFNQGASNAGHDGRLFFGGPKGVTMFYPDKIEENPHVPQIAITKFSVFNKPLPLDKPINFTDEIILTYNQNFFSLEFAALDYSAPGKNMYMYKLDGVDEDWVDAGSNRTASYTDISPGKYLFRVKGSNNDGVWNNKEVTLAIIITPPFWQTWWFKTLMSILFVVILYSGHRYRLNKLLEVERTRIRIARDLHDEVSATLTGISYFMNAVSTEVGEHKTPKLNKLLNLIQERTSEVQESMSDIIWSINPQNDSWEIILPKFNRYASELFESKGIKYNISIPENFANKKLTMERRRNFWLMIKEMVTNITKHSECSFANIKIELDTKYVNLVIEDNGKGFDPAQQTEGNGVKNIFVRAKSLNGEIKLNSESGKGTKWELKIPV
ncbi:MAG: two-component regulator propeller domain-containing protein [bacterium]